MADIPVFYMLNPERLLPAEALDLWLGRIVKNYNEPDGHYTPQDPQPLIVSPKAETIIDDVTQLFRRSTNSNAAAHLGKLASGSRSHGLGSRVDFSTSRIRCVRLENHPKVFHALKQDQEVLQDLATMLTPGGKPAFMIVAVLIWTDAKIMDVRVTSDGDGLKAGLPVSMITAAATGIPIRGLDPVVSTMTHDGVARRVEATSKGSHIFAIQYKTVRRPAYSLVTRFKLVMEDRGPRLNGSSKTFAGVDEAGLEDNPAAEAGEDADVALVMDEDYISWTDVLEEGPEVEEPDNGSGKGEMEIAFAFDP